MFISRFYSTLFIIFVISLSLNNRCNVPGKRYVQILHHFHPYEMPSSLNFPNSSRLHRFFGRALVFNSIYICWMIFKSVLWTRQILNTVTPSSVKLKNLTFFHIRFIQQLCVFRTIQVSSILTNFLEALLLLHPQSIRLLLPNFAIFVV